MQKLLILTTLSLNLSVATSVAQPADAPTSSLFRNVKVFDGKSDKLTASTNVLILGNKIHKIGEDFAVPADATIIDGGGRTLMPGLIDNHWHAMLAAIPLSKLRTADIGYVNLVAGKQAKATLLRGFTTVRDVGGPVFGLKKAIDEGVLEGPRIYPCGAFITQTSGHGDYRGPNDVPAQQGRPLTYPERVGLTLIADGRPEVIKRTREVLRMGASQIKVMAGGGVVSDFDPLDVTQYTLDEMKAAVEVAKTWNTYVTVHAYTNNAIRQAVEAGVKCVEHGHLMDEETMKLLAKKDVWLSMQPFGNENGIAFPKGSSNAKKQQRVNEGTSIVYRLARKHKVKLAWGTDILFSTEAAKKQGKELVKLMRWFERHEVLKMATHDNAQLLKLCGPRDPYPGKLGVVEEGALADLLLVDGDPLKELKLIEDPEKNFVVIMKDGKIYKNALK